MKIGQREVRRREAGPFAAAAELKIDRYRQPEEKGRDGWTEAPAHDGDRAGALPVAAIRPASKRQAPMATRPRLIHCARVRPSATG